MNRFRNIRIKPNVFNMTIYAAQGDIGSIIAMHKIIELRNSISFANFAINRANEETDNFIKYTLYRSAILDYNSCYDYILQIIYFGFDFCSRVDSNKNYISQMKDDCRLIIEDNSNNERKLIDSPFKTNIQNIKKQNSNARDFFKKLKEFRSNLRKSDYDISEWANSIKHRGGFIVDELLDKKTLARVTSNDKNGEELFDSAYVFSTITFDEIKERLAKQNSLIVEFLIYLQNSLFGDTSLIEDVEKSQKLFSANCYDKNELKGNTYLTSFEDKE